MTLPVEAARRSVIQNLRQFAERMSPLARQTRIAPEDKGTAFFNRNVDVFRQMAYVCRQSRGEMDASNAPLRLFGDRQGNRLTDDEIAKDSHPFRVRSRGTGAQDSRA